LPKIFVTAVSLIAYFLFLLRVQAGRGWAQRFDTKRLAIIVSNGISVARISS
jgi:hypothetical protein